MNRKIRPEIPGRFILFILASIAVVLLFVSYTTGFTGGIIRSAADTIFVPMQKGIDTVSDRILLSAEQTATMEELVKENERLSEEVERLSSELSGISLRENELEDLRTLMELKNTYSNYKTTGAYVIGKDASNWFTSFTIDKGSDDGIKENMNVLAGEGLVGIVTNVGKHHATVRAIIDDSSNVSAMISDTGNNFVVSGSTQNMTDTGMITFSYLEDLENTVKIGDTIVTSSISNKYVPGILIGYISEIKEDPNGLTKSGLIAPVADFKHLNEVLVVQTLKQNGDEE